MWSRRFWVFVLYFILFKVSLIFLWLVYLMFLFVSGIFCVCLICLFLGVVWCVLVGCFFDLFLLLLFVFVLLLDDVLDLWWNLFCFCVVCGELGWVSVCFILLVFEECFCLWDRFYKWVYGVYCCVKNICNYINRI